MVLEASGRHGGHVLTANDGLSDGLYGDFGQEHIAKPGYTFYFGYIKEFNLEVLPYPRRKAVLRRINGKFYTEEMLADPVVLRELGFNEKEVKYISTHAWWDPQALYVSHCLDKFTDEYQPFNVGYDHLDKIPMSDIYKKEGASPAALRFLGGGRALVAFREVYPGKRDTIEQVISKDWTKDAFSPTCERNPFPIGELNKFWPNVMKPIGRIHFAGVYADNLNWGTDAATRSANRVANEIDQL